MTQSESFRSQFWDSGMVDKSEEQLNAFFFKVLSFSGVVLLVLSVGFLVGGN